MNYTPIVWQRQHFTHFHWPRFAGRAILIDMEAVIEKVVHGGYGLARVRGVVCLVPFSVPGDVLDVECSLDHEIAFGWIQRIIEPSPRRRVSGCPVFGLCGGCDYDHMEYACELEVKKGILL